MSQSFIIKGNFHKKDKCLPDLNDLISEACRHPKAYGRYKADYEMIVINAIHVQLKRWKPQGKVRLDIEWGEPKKSSKPRDEDNVIAGGRKIIHDSLVRANVLKDDTPEYVEFGRNRVVYTDAEPYVKVNIIELA